MKKTLPTADRLREVMDYNPETGEFTRRSSGKTTAMHSTEPYLRIRIDGIDYRAHRLAWLYVTGKEPEDIIDHIDGNSQNNRFSNLREANTVQNKLNSEARPRITGLPRGVYRIAGSKKFRAEIKVNKRQKHLGAFDTPEEASEFYQLAADLLHGEFAFHRCQGAAQQGEKQ